MSAICESYGQGNCVLNIKVFHHGWQMPSMSVQFIFQVKLEGIHCSCTSSIRNNYLILRSSDFEFRENRGHNFLPAPFRCVKLNDRDRSLGKLNLDTCKNWLKLAPTRVHCSSVGKQNGLGG